MGTLKRPTFRWGRYLCLCFAAMVVTHAVLRLIPADTSGREVVHWVMYITLMLLALNICQKKTK